MQSELREKMEIALKCLSKCTLHCTAYGVITDKVEKWHKQIKSGKQNQNCIPNTRPELLKILRNWAEYVVYGLLASRSRGQHSSPHSCTISLRTRQWWCPAQSTYAFCVVATHSIWLVWRYYYDHSRALTRYDLPTASVEFAVVCAEIAIFSWKICRVQFHEKRLRTIKTRFWIRDGCQPSGWIEWKMMAVWVCCHGRNTTHNTRLLRQQSASKSAKAVEISIQSK